MRRIYEKNPINLNSTIIWFSLDDSINNNDFNGLYKRNKQMTSSLLTIPVLFLILLSGCSDDVHVNVKDIPTPEKSVDIDWDKILYERDTVDSAGNIVIKSGKRIEAEENAKHEKERIERIKEITKVVREENRTLKPSEEKPMTWAGTNTVALIKSNDEILVDFTNPKNLNVVGDQVEVIRYKGRTIWRKDEE